MNAWREAGYPGVTAITKRLLDHWYDPEEREDRRFFFCQLEAVEALVWLTEGPDADKVGIDIPQEGGSFHRLCAKMANHLQGLRLGLRERACGPANANGRAWARLARRQFQQVVKAAGVKAIKVHGTRHTVATLLLQAGVAVQDVAQRLGHAKVTQTLEVYAHSMPDMQRDAAAKLGALLTNC